MMSPMRRLFNKQFNILQWQPKYIPKTKFAHQSLFINNFKIARFESQYSGNQNSTIKSPITWVSLAITTALGGIAAYYFQDEKQKKLSEGKSFGKPTLGGPFTLVDQKGVPRTDVDFRGMYMILYFGFTFCPDICPIELTKMAEVVEKLSKQRGVHHTVQPVFITVDPNRDTVAQIATYAKDFHPQLIALTGTPEQISDVCKAYRVYHSKSEAIDDYLVDHTIIMYLVGPDGSFIDYYGNNLNAEQVAQRITKEVMARNSWWQNFM